ncbi:MAG TPA: DegV family protein [Bacilli bacterium]
MKRKIAILTDSSSTIYTFKHDYDNIFMINLPCYIGDEVFTDFDKHGDTLFYQALKNTKLVPKTSQPSVGETLDMFNKIKSLGYTDIIYMPISKELSGTYLNGHTSKEMVDGINVEIIDTKATVSILGAMTVEAARLASLGKSVEEIKERVTQISANAAYYLVVNDLTSLVQNGRLSYAKYKIANLFHIKPLIILNQEGRLLSLENVRTYKAAIKKAIDYAFENLDPECGEIHVSYTDNTEDLEYTIAEILKIKPDVKYSVYTIPSTVTAHVGMSAIGVAYINYKKE